MASLSNVAIENAIKNLQLRDFADIPDDTASLKKIHEILKDSPTEKQLERLAKSNVIFDPSTDLSNHQLRAALNLLHTDVFPKEKLAAVAVAFGVDAKAFAVNEFHPAIRKAMKLPPSVPRTTVAQFLARLRVTENRNFTAESSERGKNIEESTEGPLSSHHVNAVLTAVAKNYAASEADLQALPACRYETRDFFFDLIAKVIERGDEAQVAELQDYVARALVEVYYTAAHPEMYELFSHMAASELMLIDADSLIITAMCNANVDWDLMQTVHVAYLVHKYVMDLKNRGAKIHIVFFECHDWFWGKSPQKRLIRNAVLGLLSARATMPNAPYAYHTFASYHDAAFAKYVARESPEFIVVNDGEEMHPIPANPAVLAAVPNDKFRSVLGCDELGAKAAGALHRMVLYFIAKRIHVVYSARQIHKDNNIFGFTVRASSVYFVPFEPLVPLLEAQCAADARAYAAAPAIDIDEDEGIDRELAEAVTGTKSNGLLAAVVAAHHMVQNGLADDKATLAVLKAAIIAITVQPYVSIETRYQDIDSKSPSAAPFIAAIDTLAGLMADVWPHLPATYGTDADAFDGHLVAAVSLVVAKTPVKDLVDTDTCDTINAAWAAIVGDEGATITDAVITGAPEVAHKPAAPSGPFIYYNHQLVNDLAKTFNVEPLPTGSRVAEVADTFIASALSKFDKWRPNFDFIEYNAVISDQELQAKRLEEEARAATNRRYRDALKRKEARYFIAIDEIARSMNVLESKVTTGKSAAPEDSSSSAAAPAAKGHAGQKKSAAPTRTQSIRESNATELIIKSVAEVMERSYRKLDLCARHRRDYQPLEARSEQTADLLRVLKDLLDYANSINIIRESDEELRNCKGEIPYVDLFTRAYKKGAEGTDAYTFICKRKTKDAKDAPFAARELMERIAKESSTKQAEDLASLLKKGEKKKLSEADEKKVAELKASILVNETSPERCAYFAARCFASMFQRYVRFEILCQVLEFRLFIWRAYKEKWISEMLVLATEAEREEYLDRASWDPAIELWLIAHRILETFSHEPLPVPNLSRLDLVRSAIDNLDLGVYRSTIFDREIKRALNIDSIGAILSTVKSLPVQMNATSFQLRRLGDRLQRDVPEKPDPRVVFNADMWQRDLMDIVDRRGSAIVSAPTSSGKTFISYYCMEQVFSQVISADTPSSDIGVVVYVAPTRALINQATADVYGRYKSKSYGTLPLKIFGVLGGREFVRTPFECQALITLPDVLETILLSPHNQKWLKRVKYFIFDEVHTMEDSGNGAVWERLLSLIRAPFVALSATIGDTQNLLDWLNRAQARQKEQLLKSGDKAALEEKRDFNVQLIPKDGTTIARWSDIEKHVFIPTEDMGMPTLNRDLAPKHVKASDIVDFHPLSVANFEMLNRKNAFPADLGIVPRETVQLLEQMQGSFDDLDEDYAALPCVKAIGKRLDALEPNTTFAGFVHISQRKAREWEANVKKELLLWVRMGTAEGLTKLVEEGTIDLGDIAEDEDEIDNFANEMKRLAKGVLGAFSAQALSRENELIKKARVGEMPYPDTTAFIHAGIVRCLFTLISRRLAPAIIFVLDQEECEALVETVISAMEEAEREYRSTPAFIAYEMNLAIEKEKNEKLKSTRASMTHQSEDGEENRNQGRREVGDVGNIRPDSDFIIPEVLPEFTFAPVVVSDDDLKNALEENPSERRSLLFRALQRGIGMHHNGVSGKLRGSVERAFRKLQLPFVFSTEGLALGIHSPCRTVVLAGDNIALNVSEFRQMAGRAGRRGLDFLGHVVFFGISFKKIKRLMTGEMANLRGHSQIDPTTSLRLLELYNTKFPDKPGYPNPKQWHDTVSEIATLAYIDPLFVRGRAESRDYATDHVALLRHMMTYYVREGLVNTPSAASSIGNMLVTMLNIRNTARLEGAGFALVSMLTNQIIEKAAVATVDVESAEYTRQRMFGAALAVSYVLTKHFKFHVPLEMHRSVTRDALATFLKTHVSARSHTVYLPNPSPLVKGALDLQAGRILKVLSSYLADRATLIPLNADLPLGLTRKNGTFIPVVATDTDPSVQKMADALAATAVKNVKARHPLIAVCGKNDTFDSVEDVTQSLAKGLFLDISDVPALDLVDLGRHDGSPVIINACFYDYLRNGSQKRGETYTREHLLLFNHLSQSSSWGTLNRIFVAMDSLNISLGTIGNVDNQTCSAIALLNERCAALRPDLDNRAAWRRFVATTE